MRNLLTRVIFRTILVLNRIDEKRGQVKANMLIKKETEYAILGLMALAGENGFTDVKQISEREHISETLLSKAFQKLAKAGVLESQLGPSGGFRLKKAPDSVFLLEIFEAVQGTKVMKCYEGDASYCPKASCVLKKTIMRIEKRLDEFLSETSLKSVIGER